MKKISLRATVVAVAALASTSAFATDGYFPHGYGMKAKGMGGVSTAMANSAFAGATNPAVAAFSGNRTDVGVDLFMPNRGVTEYAGAAEDVSGSKQFLVPEFGYNTQINDKMFGGVSVYGNGGMNTDYAAGAISSFMAAAAYPSSGANAKTGMNLEQLIVAPTFAYKLNENASIGVSPLLVYQKFKADGLLAFGSGSSSPANLTDNGNDTSTGVGVRLGYFMKSDSGIDLGFAYSPKIKMSKFGKYKGLFAEDGGFDIPANYSFGLAFSPSKQVKVGVDYQRIEYAGVPSVANPSENYFTAGLGPANGAGFGWSNVNIVKLGVEWIYSPTVVLRAGYNHSTNPIQGRDVTFNILAPGVTTDHYTIGGTYMIGKSEELTWAMMYAPKKSVTGTHLFDGLGYGFNGWSQTLQMSQKSIGVQYSWKF